MLKIGVSSGFVLDLPGLEVRLLLLGVDTPEEDLHGEVTSLTVRVVVDSPRGRDVHEVSAGGVIELIPGRLFSFVGFSEPLALFDEVGR